jgi:hypothetical protein|tara:strand:+ start:588 stop:758 length:171 start_codon:yes stop_codon:yes gene_type:complete
MAHVQSLNTSVDGDLKFKFFAALIELQKHSPNDNVDSFGQEYNIDEMLSYLERELV